MNRSRRKVWVTRGQQVPRPKPAHFQKKFMLCVWWCSDGLAHYELLPAGKTVNADFYCRQLTTVMEKLANFPEGRLRDSGHASFTTTRHPTQRRLPRKPSNPLAFGSYPILRISLTLPYQISTSSGPFSGSSEIKPWKPRKR